MGVSIIMPVYNETINELNDSINSILNQTFNDFEYIIIDDNPRSLKIKNFLIKKSKQDYRIKLLFNKRHVKQAASYNIGILNSHYNLIARMDADDISDRNRIMSQIRFMTKYNLDFVVFNFSTFSSSNGIINKYCYSRITQVNQYKIKRTMSHLSITNGPSFLFKKKVFDNVGHYRQSCIDDYDFACRALIKGYKLGYQGTPYIYKRVRNNNISSNNRLKQFICIKLISKYLRKYNFSRIIPLSKLINALDNINKRDIYKFNKVELLILNIKNCKHLFFNLVKLILIVSSSKILLQYVIWTIFVNKNQDIFLR